MSSTQRVPLASAWTDAVLVLPDTPGAAAQEARLLAADATTSAPVGLAGATLTLSGPAAAEARFTGADGVHTGALTLPAAGEYAGSLILDREGRADLLAVTGVKVQAPDPAPLVAAGSPLPWIAAAVLGATLLGAGYALGRRAAAAAWLAALLLLDPTRPAVAHGGEDHGAVAVTAPAGADLVLPMERQFLIGLRTLRVDTRAFTPHTLGIGALTSAPGGAATVRAPFVGVVEAPAGGLPAPGAVVHAGQVLAVLRETPSTADRAAVLGQRSDAEARLAEARAALALAERDLERAAGLGASLSERERLERANAVAVATVAVSEAERAAAAGTTGVPIVAPLSGRLSAVDARPGDGVADGTPLFRIVSEEALWVRAQIPESEAAGVRAGGVAEVTVPSVPGRTWPAVIVDGGLEADPTTGTVAVTLLLDPDPSLRPGLAANAWIPSGPAEEVVTVPDDAVVESDGVALVFVKLGPERFAAREVALGSRSGATWEVHAGLAAGERVVVAGTYPLKSLAGR